MTAPQAAGPAATLQCGDRLDHQTATHYRRAIGRAITALARQGGAALTIDLSQVATIDAMGLAVLVSALKDARKVEVEVVLQDPAPTVRRLIELTRLQHLFEIAAGSPLGMGTPRRSRLFDTLTGHDTNDRAAPVPPRGSSAEWRPVVALCGMTLARLTGRQLLDKLFAALARGQGGWIVTANMDFLRRYAKEPAIRHLYDAADVRVADGMPLVWAAKLKGQPLPERIAGSSLVWDIAERAAAERQSLYLLGGEPGIADRAQQVLRERWPHLIVCGWSAPAVPLPLQPAQVDSLRDELTRLRPAIVLVALGSPKQEWLIQELRADLPGTWMVGIGMSLSFVAGHVKRAPRWMQSSGLEWVHRLLQEPRRLARRYLIHDLPFLVRLLCDVLRPEPSVPPHATQPSHRRRLPSWPDTEISRLNASSQNRMS
jgi:N-acetylglucosaminyldiphosphoundecaprenol N-acetyl-beta-D-mannosaminyltransferase